MDVTPEGAADILNRLADRLGGEQLYTRLQPYMDKAFDALRPKLAEYPGPHSGPLIFTSRRQRVFFWRAVKEGLIKVPYDRTGALGRGWQADVQYTVSATGLTGILANSASDWRADRPYGQYVTGAMQEPMHAGTWTPTSAVAEQNKALAVKEIAEGIAAVMREVVQP